MSYDPSFPGGDPNLDTFQSEQSAARFFDGPDRRPALAVGYNDGRGYTVGGTNRTGAAVSYDEGDQFFAGLLSLLLPPPSDGRHFIRQTLGDPWLATNLSRDKLYYVSLADTFGSNTPDSLVVSLRDSSTTGWHAAFDPSTTAHRSEGVFSPLVVQQGIDQPKIAVSQDAAEDIYLSHSCAFDECSDVDKHHVSVIRLRSPDRVFEELGFAEVAPITNPILGTDAHDPDAVFVAYQLLVGGDSDMQIRVARSPDRGLSWPLAFQSILAEHVTFDTEIKAVGTTDDLIPCDLAQPGNCEFAGQTCTSMPGSPLAFCTPAYVRLRDGIVMDYFVANDGWHYLAYEDRGLVYVSFSRPTLLPGPNNQPVGVDGVLWSEPQLIGLLPKPGPNHARDFQPAIAAIDGRVMVVFYEQAHSSASTFVLAFISSDHADPSSTWTPVEIDRDGSGATILFEPCPVRLSNRNRRYYFGDYIDVVPMSLPGLPSAAFYATWTDSRVPEGDPGPSCRVTTSTAAVHQHTYGVVVP